MDNGLYIFKEINKKRYDREKKKILGPFRIYQLINTANPALFE